MQSMTKKRTSLNIDDKFWLEWTLYVHRKTGSTYKVSEETVQALTEYMKTHPIKNGAVP